MKTCLIVDDSKIIRKVARKILEELNFTVTEAEDGKIALDYCKQNMPDAILLDWNMPVMSGMDFIKQLRSTSEGQSPIVIFCTTEHNIHAIQDALAAGANEYIMKPFDGEIIQSKLLQIGLV